MGFITSAEVVTRLQLFPSEQRMEQFQLFFKNSKKGPLKFLLNPWASWSGLLEWRRGVLRNVMDITHLEDIFNYHLQGKLKSLISSARFFNEEDVNVLHQDNQWMQKVKGSFSEMNKIPSIPRSELGKSEFFDCDEIKHCPEGNP